MTSKEVEDEDIIEGHTESDDEPDVKDDINCKHDTNDDGKYYTCCKFVNNSDKILDIIHKCSFECTYETCLKLEDLNETLIHYLCDDGEHSTEYVESVKGILSTHRKNLENELDDMMYNEFMNSVHGEYYFNYYGELPKYTFDKYVTASKVSLPRKMYSTYNRAYQDIEHDIKHAISKMNLRVSNIVWDAFDIVEKELIDFISSINVECEKFREIITHICRKVLTCISNAMSVDLTMYCISKYRMNAQ